MLGIPESRRQSPAVNVPRGIGPTSSPAISTSGPAEALTQGGLAHTGLAPDQDQSAATRPAGFHAQPPTAVQRNGRRPTASAAGADREARS